MSKHVSKIGEDRAHSSGDMLADRQHTERDKHTRLSQYFATPTGGGETSIIDVTTDDEFYSLLISLTTTNGWRRGVVVSGVRRINEVNARRARLIPGWVTVFGRVYYLGM